jgi:hypothetical protein
MTKRPKKGDKGWTPGPANPESGGGSGGKTRSPAEDKLREEFDKKQHPPGEKPEQY